MGRQLFAPVRGHRIRNGLLFILWVALETGWWAAGASAQTLTISPASGPGGAQITATSAGFDPGNVGYNTGFYVDNGFVGACPGPPGTAGWANCTITITMPGTSGIHTVNARNSNAETASQDYTALEPSFQVSKSCGPRGLTITATGNNYAVGYDAAIYLDGNLFLFNNYPDASGHFSRSFGGPDTLLGEHTVRAANSVGNDRSATYTLTAPCGDDTDSDPLPNLSVSPDDIVPTQAVFDVDVDYDGTLDLVSNRPALIRATVTVDRADLLTPGQSIDVTLTFQGSTHSVSRSIADIEAGPVEFFVTPNGDGDASLDVEVDPQNAIAESDEGDNKKGRDVTVKPVRTLTISYVKVDYLGQTPQFDATVATSADYMKGVYPVADGQFVNVKVVEPYFPTPPSYVPYFPGIYHDALMLWTDAHLVSPAPDKVVGIVSGSYFTYHGLSPRQGNVVGGTSIHLPMVSDVALVQDGFPLVTAHEIGHTFGFGEGYILLPSGSCCLSIGETTKGYWVARRIPVDNSIDYMGTTADIGSYPAGATQRWSTRVNFTTLFQKLLANPADPEVLLITGTIGRTGVVSFGPMYRSMGIPSQPPAGGHSIRALDVRHNVLAELPFTLDFRVFDEPEMEPLSEAPFAFALPFGPGVVSVEIVDNTGRVLGQKSVLDTLLAAAIAALPDAAFDSNPPQRRSALLNKVTAFGTQVTAGNFVGARNRLVNDIRKDIASWILDSYTVSSPRQYTKVQLLGLVDELAARLLTP
jgi:hypothetical protein